MIEVKHVTKTFDTEPTKTDAQIQFDKYCDDLFSEELEDDALTAHFDISNPSDYGLKYDEEDYTLGHVSGCDGIFRMPGDGIAQGGFSGSVRSHQNMHFVFSNF